MTFHQHKKPSYVCISLSIALALLLVSGFLPGTVSATPAKPGLIQEDLKNHENIQNDNTTLIVSKSEAFKAQVKDYNLKSLLSGKSTDAFSDTMHLDALTKNLVKGKLDRNKQYIKKLQSGSSQNKQNIKKVRKVLTAAKTNPTRSNKLIATGNTSNSPVAHSKSGKQYIENQALAKLNKHSANERALAKARSSNSKIVASHGRYKKVQKTGGIVGRVLSLWDAGQNAYYYDTKTKTTRFDTGLYLKNAAMNLSGLSGIVGAYKEGQKKGWLVGAYQGAKCIPLASDALNVYELTESSIGVVYDTLQSNRIIAENKGEQKRQGQEAVAKLKKLFSQVKDKESEFKTLQKKSSDLRKHFADLNKQYITVFSRLVASEQNLTSSDALLKAAEKAKPFMDASRINALKTDSKKVLLATATTIKLANATRTHHHTAGDNPENLNRTVEELKQMVAMLSARKAECEEIQNAISPLLEGGEILEGAQKQNQLMAEDSQLSSQLYQQGRKLLQEHNDLIKKAKDLKTEQDTLLAQSKRLLSYYYRNGDPKTKTDLEIAFRDVVQYKIDDYSLGKLGEGQNTMTFTFRSWRKSITTSDESPPDVTTVVQAAIFFQPDIDDLCKTLDTNLTTAQGGLNNLLNLKDSTAKSSNAKAKKYDSNHSRQKKQRVYFLPTNPELDLPLTKKHQAKLIKTNTKTTIKVSERNNKFYANIPVGTYKLSLTGPDIQYSEKTFELKNDTMTQPPERITIEIPFIPAQPVKTYNFSFRLAEFDTMVPHSGIREFLQTKEKAKTLFTITQGGFLRCELSGTGAGAISVNLNQKLSSELLALFIHPGKRQKHISVEHIWPDDTGDIVAKAQIYSGHIKRSRKSDYDDDDRVVFLGGNFNGKVTYSILPFKKTKQK